MLMLRRRSRRLSIKSNLSDKSILLFDNQSVALWNSLNNLSHNYRKPLNISTIINLLLPMVHFMDYTLFISF